MEIANLKALGRAGLWYTIIDTLQRKEIIRYLNLYGVCYPGQRIEKIPVTALADSLAEIFLNEPNQELLRHFEKSAQEEIMQVRAMSSKALQSISRQTKKLMEAHGIGKLLFALAYDGRPEAIDQIPVILNKIDKVLAKLEKQIISDEIIPKAKTFDESGDEELFAELDQLRKELTQEQQKIDALKNEREDLRKQLAELANKKGELQKENEGLLRKINNLQNEIENLKKELTLHQHDRATIRNLEKENKRLIYELEKCQTPTDTSQFLSTIKTILEQLQQESSSFRHEMLKQNQELLTTLRELDREIKGIKPFIIRLGKDKESVETKNKRIGLFVDVQNIFYSAKDYYQSVIDYEKLKNYIVRGRILSKAIAYIVSAPDFDQTGFITYLNRLGFEIRNRPLIIRGDGTKKGNVDVDIATDVLKLAEGFDILVLVSGDGDFVPLLTHLKSRGKKVEVYSFPETTSVRLQEICDEFYPLGHEVLSKRTEPTQLK